MYITHQNDTKSLFLRTVEINVAKKNKNKPDFENLSLKPSPAGMNFTLSLISLCPAHA